jgi:hypothetical protein
MPFEFLSPTWFEAVEQLRGELPEGAASIPVRVTLNLLVTETPWGETVEAHVDTSSGLLVIDRGQIENPDLHVTVDHHTARAILIEGNPQAAMTAFMAGKIKIEGDMAKLIALQTSTPSAAALKFAEQIRALTT